MQGTPGKLFYYYKDPYRKVPIFMSGEANRCVLWVGGQAESFFTICYFQELAAKLEGVWCFAQMELPSGHIGYGAQDHLCEAEDVDDVLGMLTRDYGMEEITLFATSTGVQVILELLSSGNNISCVSRVILHGIVCPVDTPIFTEKGIKQREERVVELLKAGRKEDSLGMVGFYDIPITASRLAQGGFPSLQEALWQPALQGDIETCTKALSKIGVPTLVMIATDSQYKPAKEDVEKVVKAAKESIGCPENDITVQVLNDTCDELRRLLKADIPAHVAAITTFLQAADDKRAERLAIEAAAKEEEDRQKRIALNKLMCA